MGFVSSARAGIATFRYQRCTIQRDCINYDNSVHSSDEEENFMQRRAMSQPPPANDNISTPSQQEITFRIYAKLKEDASRACGYNFILRI